MAKKILKQPRESCYIRVHLHCTRIYMCTHLAVIFCGFNAPRLNLAVFSRQRDFKADRRRVNREK